MGKEKSYSVKMHIGFGEFRAYKVKSLSKQGAREKADAMALKERTELGFEKMANNRKKH